MATHEFKLGDEVTLYSFGVHSGRVIDLSPVLVIQGRTIQPDSWVGIDVATCGSYSRWNGTVEHLVRIEPRSLPALAA